MEVLGCVLNPGPCVDGAVGSILAWFPFGILGLMFAMGMIAGAALGRWGVAAVFVALAALKIAGKTPAGDDPYEHEDPKPIPGPAPKRKPRKTIFD